MAETVVAQREARCAGEIMQRKRPPFDLARSLPQSGSEPADWRAAPAILAIDSTTLFAWFDQNFRSPVAKFGLTLGAVCGGQTDRARQLLAQAGGGKRSWATRRLISPQWCDRSWARRTPRWKKLGKSADAREGQIFYIPYDPAFDGVGAVRDS